MKISVLGDDPFKGIFIRAPVVKNPGPNVEILAKFNDDIIAVKQENIIGTSFHAELTEDMRLHKYFLNMIKN